MENVLIKIEDIFSKYSHMCSLIQVGSSLEKSDYNDLDLIFFVNNRFEGLKFLSEKFSKYDITINDDAIRIKGFFNKEISIAIYTYSNINELIINFARGEKAICEHRNWTLGYWLVEGFITDLKRGRIIYDGNNKLKDIKEKLDRPFNYGIQKILEDCKEEIEIKSSKIYKNKEKILTYSLLKNDIILAMIRSSYILSEKSLRGFKDIENIIEELPEKYKYIINSYIKDEEEKYILKIIEEINNKIQKKNFLYLGTWQFDGNFKDLTDEEILKLINYAKSIGISKFDTALVYGKGKVEKLLSKVIDDTDTILTKIPAKIKPNKEANENLEMYYDEQYINDCILKSLSNLDRKSINIILLHNWTRSWNNMPRLLDWLVILKEKNIVSKIGISLPNGYNERLPQPVLDKIDVIEAPLNQENKWILDDIQIYKENNIEIILRSLFMQGKILKDPKDYKNIINKTKLFGTSMVIGMTTKNQMDINVNAIEGK